MAIGGFFHFCERIKKVFGFDDLEAFACLERGRTAAPENWQSNSCGGANLAGSDSGNR